LFADRETSAGRQKIQCRTLEHRKLFQTEDLIFHNDS